MTLLVPKAEAPEVYALAEDDVVEVGPFTGTGLNLRSSGVMAIYRFPTVGGWVGG